MESKQAGKRASKQADESEIFTRCISPFEQTSIAVEEEEEEDEEEAREVREVDVECGCGCFVCSSRDSWSASPLTSHDDRAQF